MMSVMFTQELYAICHNIRSLHNVGSIFRTADAAGITKLYLCGYTGCPPRKEISKVALGAEKTVPWEHHTHTWRLLERLKAGGVQVIALENNIDSPSTELYRFRPQFPAALLVGNEVSGLSPALLNRADQIVHIPMYGRKESLNVAVAFGMAIYELNRWRI